MPITMEVNQSLVPRSISVPAIAPLLPVFRSQPMSVAPEAGATVELRAIYNYPPHFGEPATESIETIPCGEAEPCPVQFQWQKRTGVAAWTDVPGATTDTLTIGEIKPDQLGMYRLRVSWGPCFADYSNAAMVGPSPVYLDVRAVESESAVHLNVKSPAEVEVVIHGSANLEDWTPVATNTVHGEWTVMVPKSTDFRFFKIEAE